MNTEMHSANTDSPVLQKHKCQFKKFPLGAFSLVEIYFLQNRRSISPQFDINNDKTLQNFVYLLFHLSSYKKLILVFVISKACTCLCLFLPASAKHVNHYTKINMSHE